MENAILTNDLNTIKRYDRIYFGSECCEKLFPTKKEFNELLKKIQTSKISLTILTPHTGSRGLPRIKECLEMVDLTLDDYEIVINDFGILNLILKNGWKGKRVWGRLLQRQLGGDLHGMIDRFDITRVEYDRLENVRKIGDCSISFYYPYSFIAKTRYCVLADPDLNCTKECIKSLFSAVNENMTRPTSFKGNAQFIQDELPPDHQALKMVDRLVYQPQFPK